MTILFCNVGWMERYQGLRSGDQISGGGAFVKKEGRGHEVCNFIPDKGILYGYVQPPGKQIDIDRIGANNDDEFIDGVTVVWTAGPPGGGTVIVGWYKDATVFRNYQKHHKAPVAQSQNDIDGYWIKAPFASATLLPIDARLFEIPRAVKGGIGQSNVWYADSAESAPLVKKIRAMIKSGRTPHIKKPKRGKAQAGRSSLRIEPGRVGTSWCPRRFTAVCVMGNCV